MSDWMNTGDLRAIGRTAEFALGIESAKIITWAAEEIDRLRSFVEALAIGDPLALSDVRGYAMIALHPTPKPNRPTT
jgi:hypothetical protein